MYNPQTQVKKGGNALPPANAANAGGGVPTNQHLAPAAAPVIPQEGFKLPPKNTDTSKPHGLSTGVTSQMQTQPPPQKSRIDPSQVPRPAAADDANSGSIREFRTRSLLNQSTHAPVPQASSQYRVIDDGNASPRFLRLTVNQVPNTKELSKRIAVPLAAVIQPLAQLPESEMSVPFVTDLPAGPARCRRCRAYINCHVNFCDGGRHWTCNLCGLVNAVESDYFSNLDYNGKRRDLENRPELCYGSVDFLATQEYHNRPAMHPSYIFALDTSANAAQSGLLVAAVEAVLAALEALSEEAARNPALTVGLLTFNTQLSFFNLQKETDDADLPPMCVVPDIDDPFVPTPFCVVNYAQKRHMLEKVLRALPSLHVNTLVGEAAVGSALQAAALALQPNGGKIICVFGSPPTLGVGKVTRLDDPGAIGTDRERKVLSPEGSFYSTLADVCCATQVSVEVLAYARQYCDLVSLGQLCKRTGGGLSYVDTYKPTQHAAKLREELLRCVTRPMGMEAVLRVRCCTGLTVDRYYGSFNRTVEGDIELPSIDADKTLAVEFRLEADMGTERKEACMQCALLYTAADGSRRIRVHTLAINICSNISSIFKSADLDAVVNFMAKRAVSEAPVSGLEAVRNVLISSCVQILYVYRKYCATNPAPGQLILPESLKLLPLYTLGLLKNKALTTDSSLVRNDERAYLSMRLLTLSAAQTSTFVYPRLFPLHSLAPSHGLFSSLGNVVLPSTLSLSSEKLDSQGVYLLDNGEVLMLWLGSQVPRSFLQQVLNVGALTAEEAADLQIQAYDNDLSRRVVNIVESLRVRHSNYQVLQVVQQRDHAAEGRMMSYLIEDRHATVVSYVDFLCHIHSQIQAKLV